MNDPLQIGSLQSTSRAAPSARVGKAAPAGDDFASVLRSQLEKAGQMQNEADASVERLLTGQTQSMAEVFVTARKAEVAFSLIMEIRNKLVEAYDELRNLRV
jgi:flagellar hook-basal body complex protein FliE